MAFRVAASRPHAAEVQRVTSDRVALQEEAQSVRERKLALEEAMREERSRRLQHAAQKKPNAARQADTVRSEQSPELPADGAQPPTVSSAAAPKDVNEYRRELDSSNGNKEVYRLHYYTSGHINPADVHFYKAKGKVREYQRHAPCPPRLQSPPRHSTRHDEEGEEEPLAIMPPPGESTAEQWTKSALLRMQANQRILKRIQAREKREAAYAAARSGMRATSAQRKQSEPSQPQPQPPRATTPPRVVLSVLEPRQTSTAAPAAAVSSATGINSWRSTLASTTPAVTLQRSPPRPYFTSSPLRRFSDDTSPPQHTTLHSSPFKPSLTYSSSSLHASRVEPANPISGATSRERRATSPWRPLADSWSFTPQRAYQPIAQQGVASSTPWESRQAWEGLTRRSSPPQAYKDDASAPFSKPRPSFERAAVAKEKAEVDVSPLTPSPSVKTAPRSRGQEEREAVAAGAPVNPANAQQRPSLLAGFRMPETLLKREDLFQGTS